ncbi:MAG: APC family permease [Clostridiales bacterium]|jgi:APA family basic amino acid/polyamine antiporter|nr:APC family permease [Clostridiales bacterium]
MDESGNLVRKYGLFTAIAMVVGCVIGSGIFFRTGRVLKETGGNVGLGVLAWIIGGGLMIVCISAFSLLSKRYEKVNGIVDYSETLVSKKYGYFFGWFMATIYGPATVAYLSWSAADYTRVLFNLEINSSFVFALTAFYLIMIFGINALSPKIAGKFQVSTTAVKLVPLFLMGIVGIIVGIARGADISQTSSMFAQDTVAKVSVYGAIFTTAFAYSGWESVSCINSEVKNSKRNVPIALIAGGILIIVIYVLYFLGVSTSGNNDMLIEDSTLGTQSAITSIFGSVASTILLVFIVISCLGGTNGFMMATNKHLYSLSIRGVGPKPELFGQLDKHTNAPINSSIFAIIIAFGWLFVHMMSENGWFGDMYFDIGDVETFGFFIFCIPLFFMFSKKEKNLFWLKRFVLPVCAIGACTFIAVALIIADYKLAIVYAVTIVVVGAIGALFLIKKTPRGSQNAPVDN